LRLAKDARRPEALSEFTELAETWTRLAAEMESDEGLLSVIGKSDFGGPSDALPRVVLSGFRTKLLGYLATCDGRIAQGQENITRQNVVIATLSANGHQTRLANALLQSIRDTQRLHEDHREYLLAEIDRSPD
jgi:hypothetical protein